MSIADYNLNPALNTSISGIDISEGCSPAGYNDALRQMMADILAWTQTYGVTYPIPVGNGGTGATTAPTALTALGGLSSAYQRLPQTVQTSSFTFGTGNDGGHVRYTGAAGAGTIPPTTFVRDAIILVVNDGSGPLTLTRGSGVSMIWASSGADANRNLAVGGMATLLQVAINRWFVSGAGLS